MSLLPKKAACSEHPASHRSTGAARSKRAVSLLCVQQLPYLHRLYVMIFDALEDI